ncbi:MAG TPA: tRNA (adenosine(37)-N6)-threonylcarbamoyltransferase complex ATPase subunit type 1 TsaE [Acidimicrobiales bacterium]|nr:tRNA (adenosine(37)-N6)-threonylcarbamoyltransferase complex ATPase subunit type 1 TsaE [Acidimicrobiales bacterium]
MKPIETSSPDPDTTRKIAGSLADLTAAGDVILLDGDLGAGKTTFTQGFARRLGVTEPVTSPTFTLVRRYSTSAGFDLYHADLYRLDQLHEVVDLGFNELLDEGAAAIIEWGEKGAPALGPDHLSVRLSHSTGENERRLVFTSSGDSWCARWKLLGNSIG